MSEENSKESDNSAERELKKNNAAASGAPNRNKNNNKNDDAYNTQPKSNVTCEGYNSSLIFLVDTNVWIDWLLGHRPGSETAKQFFSVANEFGATLAYAATTLKDVFFLIQQDCKINARLQVGGVSETDAIAAKEIAWACIEQMGQLALGVGCDESDIWKASKLKAVHNDFEDNLIIATAMRAKATALITNDNMLIRHCPVAALSAEGAISYLQAIY